MYSTDYVAFISQRLPGLGFLKPTRSVSAPIVTAFLSSDNILTVLEQGAE